MIIITAKKGEAEVKAVKQIPTSRIRYSSSPWKMPIAVYMGESEQHHYAYN